MKKEICCITKEGKAENELENDSDFLPASCIVYKN